MDITDWIIRAAIFGVLAAVLIGTFQNLYMPLGAAGRSRLLSPEADGLRDKGAQKRVIMIFLLCAYVPLPLCACIVIQKPN